jgi:phospholipid/cholesterol/gamma-HCH transport system substrate-binding protein
MGRRSFAVYTGLFIVSLTFALIATAFFLRGCHADRLTYVVVADTPVTGLLTGSQVTYRGLNAGVVDGLRLDPNDPRRMLVRVRIDRAIPVTAATYGTLQLRGVTGTRTLDLDAGGPAPRLATSETQPGQIPLRPSFVDQLEGQVQQLAPKIQQIAENLALLTGPESRARVDRILANSETVTERLGAISDSVERSFKLVPGLVADGRTAARRVGVLAGNLDTFAREATKLTTSTHEELSQRTIPRLNAAFEQIGKAGGSLERLSREVETNPRSLLLGLTPPPPGPGERGYRRHR